MNNKAETDTWPNTPQEWLEMFQRVNRDCSKTGEQIMHFDDQEYVAMEIFNLTGEQDEEYARRMAAEIAAL